MPLQLCLGIQWVTKKIKTGTVRKSNSEYCLECPVATWLVDIVEVGAGFKPAPTYKACRDDRS